MHLWEKEMKSWVEDDVFGEELVEEMRWDYFGWVS